MVYPWLTDWFSHSLILLYKESILSFLAYIRQTKTISDWMTEGVSDWHIHRIVEPLYILQYFRSVLYHIYLWSIAKFLPRGKQFLEHNNLVMDRMLQKSVFSSLNLRFAQMPNIKTMLKS